MSYTTRKTPMGDVFTDLIKCGQTAAGAIIGGGTDPYLPEAICRVSQLQALSKGRTPLQTLFFKKPTAPVPTCVPTPPGKPGIGLEHAVKPLRALVYVNQHPATVWLAVTALFGVPLAVGYMIGKRKR